MKSYKKPYFTLFSAICETIESLEKILHTEEISQSVKQAIQEEIDWLKSAHQKAEEQLISD